MAQRDPKRIRDGFTNMALGVNSYWNPNLLQANQLSFAVNVSLRGGYIDTRPGMSERAMSYDNDEMQEWCDDHKVQGYTTYRPKTGKKYIVFSSGGRVFKLDILHDYSVSEITPVKSITVTTGFVSVALDAEQTIVLDDTDGVYAGYPIQIGSGIYKVESKAGHTLTCTNISMTPGTNVDAAAPAFYLDPNSPDQKRTYFVQAEQFLVIQDGLGKSIIWDGQSSRRALDDEIPTGTVMAYSKGRIWVAINDREYVASDIVGGPTGVLKMTENSRISGGGAFRIPDAAGKITGMRVMPNLDTTLGQGPLQITTDSQIFSVNAPADRDAWNVVTDPIQTVSNLHSGPLDHYGIAIVNGDMFYRARDGVRSFVMARRDFNTWAQTPISTEMNRIFRDDDQSLLQFASLAVFDNRLLITVRPLHENATMGAYCSGMVVLNFDAISSMTARSTPIWEGLWTGVRPYFIMSDIFDGSERCFIFANGTSDNSLELWELSKDDSFDGDGGRISSFIETASLKFGRMLEMKELEMAELWIDRVAGTVEFSLKYRPDQYPCWFDWDDDKEICSKYKDCTQELVDCLLSRNFKSGYKTRLRWGRPDEEDEDFDAKPSRCFYECQLRLEWEGKARVKAMLVKAIEITEEVHAGDLT